MPAYLSVGNALSLVHALQCLGTSFEGKESGDVAFSFLSRPNAKTVAVCDTNDTIVYKDGLSSTIN